MPYTFTNSFDDIAETMSRMGGSFIKALAACWRTADQNNKRILLAAFQTYFQSYDEMTTLRLRKGM